MNLYFVKSGTGYNYIMAETSEGVLCSNCAPRGDFAGVDLNMKLPGYVIAARIAEAVDPDLREDDLAWMGAPCYPDIAAWKTEQGNIEFFNRDEAFFIGSFEKEEITHQHGEAKSSVKACLEQKTSDRKSARKSQKYNPER